MKKFLHSLVMIWSIIGVITLFYAYIGGCVVVAISDDIPDKTKIIVMIAYVIVTSLLFAFADSKNEDDEEDEDD